MKQSVLLLMLAGSLLTSCNLFNSYGKKVEINDKLEVYYKGEGVTEAEATKLGEFIEDLNFSNGKKNSMQLTKEDETYVVKFVYDEKYFKKSEDEISRQFWYMEQQMSDKVFDGEPVEISLSDDKMNEFERIDPVSAVTVAKSNHIYYNPDDFSKKTVSDLGSKIEGEKFFSDFSSSKVYLSKEDGEYVLRFQPNKAYLKQQGEETYYRIIQNLQYLYSKYTLKKDVKLVVIDKDFNDVKTFDDPTEQQKALLDQGMNGQQPQQQQTQTETKAADDDSIEGGGY